MSSEPYDDIPNYQLYALVAVASGILLSLSVFGQTGRGQLYAITFLLLAMSVRFFWKLKTKTWFWMLLFAVSTAHIVFIEFFYQHDAPLMPGYKALLIEVADFAVVFFLVMRMNERFS
ncbi:MAG: hypothetical protein ACJ8FS_09625 [Sphingomicrobium sp.]